MHINQNPKKNVLILGATGFIGSHLSHYLKQDNSINLTLFSRDQNGDYRDRDCLHKAIKGQDIIYHLISESYPASTWNDPFFELEANLKPFLQCLELMALEQVKKIVFCSSGGTVYGIQNHPISESQAPKPFSPHGITKLSMEYFLEYARIKDNLNYDVYRLTNPYGPGQNTFKKGLGVIATWLNKIKNNEEIIIFGDGNIIRDYIYIDDTIHFLASSCQNNLYRSDLFNLASGETLSLNDLLSLIEKVLQKKIKVKYENKRGHDNPLVLLHNEKIKSKLPHFIFTTLEHGILQTWKALNQ